MWPKPLPNHWITGNIIGVSVDSRDHIWIIHRQGSLEAMEEYAAAKRLFNAARVCEPSAGLIAEAIEQQALIGSRNQIEAVRANLEKRAPDFADPP